MEYPANNKVIHIDVYFNERKQLILNPKSYVKFDVNDCINYEYFKNNKYYLRDITRNVYNEYIKKEFKKSIIDDYPSFFVKVYLVYMTKNEGSIPNINEYSEDCYIRYFYEQIHQYIHKKM